jgi:uncharacterized protein YodC (DUF2158 family)
MNRFKKEFIKGLMLIILMLIVLAPGFLLTSCMGNRRPTEKVCQGWAIGDVVKLKIGSPEMAVADLWQFGDKCYLKVVWTSSEGESEDKKY